MDPRSIKAPTDRISTLTPLMKAKAADLMGEGVNFCPFGCDLSDLDDHGYCSHLVGFSNDGKVMEPFVVEKGKKVVKGDRLQPVLKGDKLVQITTSSRVYRDIQEKAKTA